MDFLVELAVHQDEGPLSVHLLCKRVGASYNYISRLLVPLRKAGHITSVKGTSGGFIINTEPDKLTLLDIVDLVDGPAYLMRCLDPHRKCPDEDTCKRMELWVKPNQVMRDALRSITLQNLVDVHLANKKVQQNKRVIAESQRKPPADIPPCKPD